MRKIISVLIITFVTVNLFSQTNMVIRRTDNSTITVPISEIDSVYYEASLPNTLIDYDGNVYTSIIIGTQEWMAENLRVTHYPNGDPIPLITDETDWGNLATNNTSDAYSYYNNNSSSEAYIYGALYTYAAAIGDNWARDNTNDQGVCPNGWHLPTDVEWDALNTYLGANAGSKLADNAYFWTNGNLDQSADFSTSGFDALPGGYRYNDGTFLDLGNLGFWWTAIESSSIYAYSRYLHYDDTNVGSNYYAKSFGFNVRCVKN